MVKYNRVTAWAIQATTSMLWIGEWQNLSMTSHLGVALQSRLVYMILQWLMLAVSLARGQEWGASGQAATCSADIQHVCRFRGPADPLIFQLPETVWEKQWKMTQAFWALYTWRLGRSSGLLALACNTDGFWSHLGREQKNGNYLFLSPFLLLSFFHALYISYLKWNK